MKNQQRTKDQQKIKAWITARHGSPVEFDYPEAQADKTGLRIDFPGSQDEILHSQAIRSRKLDWDEFFTQLADRNLIFVYDNEAGKDDDLTAAYHFEIDESGSGQ